MAVPQALRRRVAQRADHRCEYCLMREASALKKHEPDHIIPVKYGGPDEEENLAWACFLCNRHRGSDVAAYDPQTGQLTPVFNPRLDIWTEHFHIEDGTIVPRSAIGRVTILALRINRPERIENRAALSDAGLYP